MYERHCRAIDVANATGINPSAICRYLSGTNKPSSDKIIALAKYLLVSPEWLLDSSEGHMLDYSSKDIAKATEPLLKQIELQDKLIKNLEKEVDRLEARVKRLEEPKGREELKSKWRIEEQEKAKRKNSHTTRKRKK